MRAHLPNPPRFARGLTLIELMVTISLLLAIMVIAIPSFQQQMAAGRLSAAANDLMASLTRTRAESMRLGTRVTACKSDGSTAACSGSTTTGWEGGWLVFQDGTRDPTDTSGSVDAGETITFVAQRLPPDLKIVGNTDVQHYVSFAADGRSKLYNGGAQSGRIRVCSTSEALADDARARDIVLAATGQLKLQRVPAIASTCPAP